MLRRGRRPRVTPEQVLRSRPIRVEGLRSERIEGGGVRLFLPRRRDWWATLLAMVFPIPRERPIELDAAGTEVWELCDGKHTLRDLVGIFVQRHKLTRAEAEWSLRTYLRDLGKRRLVAFALDDPQGGRAETETGPAGRKRGPGRGRAAAGSRRPPASGGGEGVPQRGEEADGQRQ